MDNLSLFSHIVFSFLSTVGFSIFLNAPINSLIFGGITGTLGWLVYSLFKVIFSRTFERKSKTKADIEKHLKKEEKKIGKRRKYIRNRKNRKIN